MWPLKKKDTRKLLQTKSDLTQETIDDLKSFRDIGEKFNYMGIEMIVESHYSTMINPCVTFPRILAAYKDYHGVLRHVEFKHRALPALKAENGTNKLPIPPPTVEFRKNG